MEDVSELERLIGYKFKKKDLLGFALRRASYAPNSEERRMNEKLEFLGDAVLNAVITFMLYKKFHEKDEGFLSNARSFLVRRETLNEVGRNLDLVKYMRSENLLSYDSKVISNTLEALIGAIYLDGGIKKVGSVVRRLFFRYFDEKTLEQKNPKNILQEYTQREFGVLPKYVYLRKCKEGFKVTCKVGKDFVARGSGRTKKEAEMDAARNVLRIIKPT